MDIPSPSIIPPSTLVQELKPLSSHQISSRALRHQARSDHDSSPRSIVSSSTSNSLTNHHGKNLIVNYLSLDIHENALLKRFSKYGQISHVKIARNPSNGNSLTYGFVHFKREEDATHAMELENGTEWKGKHIRVSVARTKKDNRYCKIMISNVDPCLTQDCIKRLFEEFGDIIEIRLVRSHSSQICFIEFDTIEQCLEAMTLNGKILEGTNFPVSIQLANRDHYERRIETLPDSPLDCNSSPFFAFPSSENESSCNVESLVPYTCSMPIYLNSHTLAAFPLNQFSCESVFEICGLSPTTTAMQLCTVFSQYGQILAFRLHIHLIGLHYVCSGTATIRLFGSLHLRDLALTTLNGAHVFPLEGPIFVSLL